MDRWKTDEEIRGRRIWKVATAFPRMEGSAADIPQLESWRNRVRRGELDRAIIYNVDVAAGERYRPILISGRRLRPRDTKNRSEISSSNEGLSKAKGAKTRDSSTLRAFSDHSLVSCVIFEIDRERVNGFDRLCEEGCFLLTHAKEGERKKERIKIDSPTGLERQ